ncbi:diguanylate cyclase domain-containing protein [Gloeothece verrucosa]|uniref:Diguanylate cyclase n=1 Tax=Gloeothece verrucosa (strain PCC 7822) TaxID=497965 RepID=E0U9W1_GLOV7|nr:diguanylate cyclase [Gloeothece verrucosa]ADN15031.1 diguanylate cyclase [Gloeothece verrucosa PCC 7822]
MRIIALAILYAVTAKLGQIFSLVGGSVTLIWLPAGIALAAILIFGYRLWPGIFLGVLIANFNLPIPLLSVLGMATGSSLGAIVGAYLTKKGNFHNNLDRIEDVFSLIVRGAIISPVISSLIDVPSLFLGGVIPPNQLSLFWFQFCMGDALGVLVITPVCLTWISPIKWTYKQKIEAFIFFLLLLLISGIVFNGWLIKEQDLLPAFIIYPFLVLAPLRFGSKGAATALLLVSIMALLGLVHDTGPFVASSPLKTLVLLWLFVNVAAVVGLVLAASISQLIQAKQHLEQMALYDSLTGLDNRILLTDKITAALARAKRYQNYAVVLYLDLDGFKLINDTMGHDMGDQVLIEVAKRLKMCVRQTDAVARIGGDEFVVLLQDVNHIQGAERVAQEIIQIISRPIQLHNKQMHIGVSIGVAVAPGNGTNLNQLLRNADHAMYHAKQSGKNTYKFYSVHEFRESR